MTDEKRAILDLLRKMRRDYFMAYQRGEFDINSEQISAALAFSRLLVDAVTELPEPVENSHQENHDDR